jgi:hypothetical protein
MLIVFSSLTCACYSQSQGLRVGPTFGLGESMFQPQSRFDQQPRLGLSGGIVATDQLLPFFGLETDILLTSKGTILHGTQQNGTDLLGNPVLYKYHETYDLLYAEIPFLLKASVGAGGFHFKAFAGPALNYNLAAWQSRVYDDQTYNASNGFSRNAPNIAVTELTAVYDWI